MHVRQERRDIGRGRFVFRDVNHVFSHTRIINAAKHVCEEAIKLQSNAKYA
jgi:hypothetical protein